jgi:putative oxidoreductase
MLRRLIATPDDVGPLLARLTLGLAILPHGMQKLFGSFGGYGFDGTMGFFTGTMHIPWVFALLAIVAEFFGALGLLVGLFGRLAALGVGVTMAVAALTSHLQYGFFMNGKGTDGVEYFVLAVGLALVVLVKGSGALSLDRALARRLAGGAPAARPRGAPAHA